MLGLVILIIAFDSLMIAVDLFRYDHEQPIGIFVGPGTRRVPGLARGGGTASA